MVNEERIISFIKKVENKVGTKSGQIYTKALKLQERMNYLQSQWHNKMIGKVIKHSELAFQAFEKKQEMEQIKFQLDLAKSFKANMKKIDFAEAGMEKKVETIQGLMGIYSERLYNIHLELDELVSELEATFNSLTSE